MLDKTATRFSHVKPADTPWRSGGLRDFFLYRDLGVAEATHGKVIAHLVFGHDIDGNRSQEDLRPAAGHQASSLSFRSG